MSETTEDQLAAEVLALLRGGLDPVEAWNVAARLAAEPDRAAAALAAARDAEGVRAALATLEPSPPPAPLIAAARRLEHGLRRRRLARRAAPVAAALAMFVAGWGGHLAWRAIESSGAPPLLEAALDAKAALTLRHWMTSQPESVDIDAAEILAALGVELPPLPEGWIVRDVQVVAAPARPAVAIAIDAPELGPVLLFAVARGVGDAAEPPTAFEHEGRAVALFDRAGSAFVLVDDVGRPDQLALQVARLIGSKE